MTDLLTKAEADRETAWPAIPHQVSSEEKRMRLADHGRRVAGLIAAVEAAADAQDMPPDCVVLPRETWQAVARALHSAKQLAASCVGADVDGR